MPWMVNKTTEYRTPTIQRQLLDVLELKEFVPSVPNDLRLKYPEKGHEGALSLN